MQFNEEKNLVDIEFLLPTSKVKVNLSCIRLHVEKCVIAYLRKLLECGIASQESVKVLNPNSQLRPSGPPLLAPAPRGNNP